MTNTLYEKGAVGNVEKTCAYDRMPAWLLHGQFDSGEHVAVLFLDLLRTFDSLQISFILKKLEGLEF